MYIYNICTYITVWAVTVTAWAAVIPYPRWTERRRERRREEHCVCVCVYQRDTDGQSGRRIGRETGFHSISLSLLVIGAECYPSPITNNKAIHPYSSTHKHYGVLSALSGTVARKQHDLTYFPGQPPSLFLASDSLKP